MAFTQTAAPVVGVITIRPARPRMNSHSTLPPVRQPLLRCSPSLGQDLCTAVTDNHVCGNPSAATGEQHHCLIFCSTLHRWGMLSGVQLGFHSEQQPSPRYLEVEPAVSFSHARPLTTTPQGPNSAPVCFWMRVPQCRAVRNCSTPQNQDLT